MNDQQLLETLQDVRAFHENDYQWETQRIGNGGSKIAAGRARRYADAIAIAAIRLSNQQEPTSGPRWFHWAILGACILATVALTIAESTAK